jgi:hypothetical protein
MRKIERPAFQSEAMGLCPKAFNSFKPFQSFNPLLSSSPASRERTEVRV